VSNEIDLENDEEWLLAPVGFLHIFWQTRVPELLYRVAEARELPVAPADFVPHRRHRRPL
jgi:hypothetical protein